MLKQCARCRLYVEVDAPACCRNCGAEIDASLVPRPREREESAPNQILEDVPTRKRPIG